MEIKPPKPNIFPKGKYTYQFRFTIGRELPSSVKYIGPANGKYVKAVIDYKVMLICMGR